MLPMLSDACPKTTSASRKCTLLAATPIPIGSHAREHVVLVAHHPGHEVAAMRGVVFDAHTAILHTDEALTVDEKLM